MSMFGTRPHNPPSGVLPVTVEDQLLPRPQRVALDGKFLRLTEAGELAADLICNEPTEGSEGSALTWLQNELHNVYGLEIARSKHVRAHLVVGTSKPGSVVFEWEKKLKISLVEQSESYTLQIGEDHVALVAKDGVGILRGVTTLFQLMTRNHAGELSVPQGRIQDWPAFPVRMLIGFMGSGRKLREIINLAFRYKFNRIFYFIWNWTSGERLSEVDHSMVEYARSLGIELMFQLSRLSFPEDFDATREEDVNRIVNLYEAAIDIGFRSFGILFDDQTFESVEAEMNLTLAIYHKLRERLGKDFEFTFVPEVYWVPGELAGWPPRPERAEEFRLRHIEYLQKMGAALPTDVKVYIANNWNDYPEGYTVVQEREFNRLARRKPIFFENQLVNDYRRSIILPFPVHNRPPEFTEAMAGYGLNMPMPHSAYHPTIMTCGALAWNVAGYNPPVAWGAAVQHCFGEERSSLVLEGLNALNKLFVEWTHPHFPAANHYASLSAKLKDGKLTLNLIRTWRERLWALRSTFSQALGKSGTGTEALQYYLEEMGRLDLDMAVFQDMLETGEQLLQLSPEGREGTISTYRARQEARYGELLRIEAHRAPHVEGVQKYLAEKYGPRQSLTDRSGIIPAGWWVTYCYGTMKDEIENTLRAGEEFLSSKGANVTALKQT